MTSFDAIPYSFGPAPRSPKEGVAHRDAELAKATMALEASFLAELLKSTDLGQVSDSFGGGAGEEQFASLLIDERAKMMAEAGGIGLAQSIFNALKGRADV